MRVLLYNMIYFYYIGIAMSNKVTRETVLNILQTETNSRILLTTLRRNSDIKKAIKSLWLETSDDQIRASQIQAHPAITMYFFTEALSTRDFKQLKALLPHLYKLEIDNLLTAYGEGGIYWEIFNLKGKAWEVKKNLENCQKDLINKNGYDADDVWLLVMFALIHPFASALPLSKLSFINSPEPSQLILNYAENMNKQAEFNLFQTEIGDARQKFETIKKYYFEQPNEINVIRQASELSLIRQKEAMENTNLLFNIINVFAWLPLLLTNLKRVCYGESPRLFHYVGLDYNKKVMKSMLNTLSSTDSNAFAHQMDGLDDGDLIRKILSKNKSTNEYELRFDSPLSDDEMPVLITYLIQNRNIYLVMNGPYICGSRTDSNPVTKYEDRNNILSHVIPKLEEALQSSTLATIDTQLKQEGRDYKDRWSTPYRMQLQFFVETYYTNNGNKWKFTQEELTPAERNRIANAYNLYRAVNAIKNNHFDAAHKFLSKIHTSLGKQIEANLRIMLQDKLQNMDAKILTQTTLRELKADLTQPNNRQILNNEYACQTIKLIIMSGVPIEYDYFGSLPHITEGLLGVFQNMQQCGRLNDSNTKNLFKICDAMQLSSTNAVENPEDIIDTSDFPEDVKQALRDIVHQNTSAYTASI